MNAAERRIRSQLAQLVSGFPLVRGSPSVRGRTCGKPNCRCARGEKHVSLYLVASEGGKPQQLFIPKALESEARRWVEDYRRVRELLEELSKIYWDKLKRREL
jgi:hypothetical protein